MLLPCEPCKQNARQTQNGNSSDRVLITMADSDADLIEADLNDSASGTSTTRRSTRSATRQAETGPGLLDALFNQGINPAPGLSASQLQSLAQEVSPGTPAQVEPIPAVPGRKRTHKSNHSSAPPAKRKAATPSSPNPDHPPTHSNAPAAESIHSKHRRTPPVHRKRSVIIPTPDPKPASSGSASIRRQRTSILLGLRHPHALSR